MRCFWICFSIVIATLVGPPPALSDEALSDDALLPDTATYDLAYQFSEGETLRWEVTHTATVQTTIQGTSQKAQTRSESVKAWRVTEVTPDGVTTLIHSVESVKMVNQLPERAEMTYDSQTDATAPAGFEDVARAIGVPLTMIRLDVRGKVLKRETRHPQPAASNDSPITVPLPDEAIAVGHSWTADQTTQVKTKEGAPRRVKVRRRFELLKVEDRVATIGMEFQVLEPQVRRDPAIMAQLVQQQVSGKIEFDIERGRVVGQNLKVDQRVLDFGGPSSSMHYVMHFTERLLKPDEKIARRPKPAESAGKE
jgi:hypothetical protein